MVDDEEKRKEKARGRENERIAKLRDNRDAQTRYEMERLVKGGSEVNTTRAVHRATGRKERAVSQAHSKMAGKSKIRQERP